MNETYLGDTLDHVLDVRANGANGSSLLLGTKPLVNLDLLAIRHLKYQKLKIQKTCSDKIRIS